MSNDENLIATISDKLQHNFFITGNGHVPSGDGKSSRRKHRHKRRHHKHKVIDHEAKKAEKKLKAIEKDVIYEDPDSLKTSKKHSKSDIYPEPRYVEYPLSTPRKSLDVEAGKRSTRASLDILRPLSQTPELKTIDEIGKRNSKDRRSGSRRSSKATSSSSGRRQSSDRRSSKSSSHKVSLSPGEYAAREEYDKKLRELSDIREGLVDDTKSKKVR